MKPADKMSPTERKSLQVKAGFLKTCLNAQLCVNVVYKIINGNIFIDKVEKIELTQQRLWLFPLTVSALKEDVVWVLKRSREILTAVLKLKIMSSIWWSKNQINMNVLQTVHESTVFWWGKLWGFIVGSLAFFCLQNDKSLKPNALWDGFTNREHSCTDFAETCGKFPEIWNLDTNKTENNSELPGEKWQNCRQPLMFKDRLSFCFLSKPLSFSANRTVSFRRDVLSEDPNAGDPNKSFNKLTLTKPPEARQTLMETEGN